MKVMSDNMKRHYVIEENKVLDMKYCPFCGKEIVIYTGDYGEWDENYPDCECEDGLSFWILEEMIYRNPKQLIEIINAPLRHTIKHQIKVINKLNGHE